MYNVASLIKCFHNIYYIQQWGHADSEGGVGKWRWKGTWMIWKRQAFLETFFYSPLDINFFNIVLSCIRRNWIHWRGPWWTAGGGGESCSSTVTSGGSVQTLGSISITCKTSYLCVFVQVLPRRRCEWKSFWNIFPHICFIHWCMKYNDPDFDVCLFNIVQVD